MKWMPWMISLAIVLLTAFLFTVYSWHGMTEMYAGKVEEKQELKQELEDEIVRRKEAEPKYLKIIAPVEDYKVTSDVGMRKNPMGGDDEGFHRGLDMVGPIGGYICTAADGIVVDHWPPPGEYYQGHPTFGGMLIIDHGGGIYTLYGHLRTTYVKRGDRVTVGQKIGRQGNTGVSSGEHLHFEVIVDPAMMLEGLLLRAVEAR